MKVSTASVLAIAITLASTHATQAQTSLNNKDDTKDYLQWRPMAIASFNYGRINVPDVSRADMNLARTVWNQEINSAPLDDDGTKLPSFILVSSVTNQGVQYTFSIFSSAGTPGCIEPGNGSGIEDMYETCPLRVTEFQGSQSRTQEFQNYCHLYPFPPDHPGDVNQTEFAFDEKNMTAHFRVIQHGKHVPACDRKLELR